MNVVVARSVVVVKAAAVSGVVRDDEVIVHIIHLQFQQGPEQCRAIRLNTFVIINVEYIYRQITWSA